MTGFDPGLTRLMVDYGVDLTRVDPEARIDQFVLDHGEPAFAALVLALEDGLPEEFPEELLAQIDTLRELLEFAEIKRQRA